MDQYFERLNQAAENPQMPRRIQFMIQDLVDMRRNRWLPRKIGAGSEGPRTIQQIREDAYRDGGIYLPQQSPPSNDNTHMGKRGMGHAGNQGHHGGSAFINPLERGFFDSGSGGRKGNDDLFALGVGIAGFGSSSPYLGTGPGAIPAYGESVSPTPPSSMSREPQSAPPTLNGFNKGGGDRRGSEEGGRRDSRSPPSSMHDRDGPRGERPKGQQPPHRGSPVDGGGGRSSGGGALPPRMMNKDRANDTRENRDRGGHFLGSDRGDDPADFTPRHLPALDFGDRYSANRSKDRERRERFGGQGVGGAFKETRGFNDDGGRFGDGGGPNRDFGMMSDSRLPPRFKKMVLSNQQQQPQQQQQQPTGGQYHQGQAPMSQPPHLQQTLQGPPPPKPSGQSMQSSAPSRNSGGGEVSLRPQGASNMLFKPKTPSMLPKSAISSSEGSSPLGENSLNRPAPTMQQMGGKVVMMRQQEPAIILKQSSHLDKQGRNKEKNKQKGPTR